MALSNSQNPCIFFLSLEEHLPKTYYIFDGFLKELGFMLVPVRIDQLQLLIAATEQDQVIVLCSVSDAREFRIYNEKIRGFLRFVLKSKRLSFIHLSSFSLLNDQRFYALQKNYFFIKYPLNAKDLCAKLARFHVLKREHHTLWPGGKRATLGSGVS
jgi:hypothetical protein